MQGIKIIIYSRLAYFNDTGIRISDGEASESIKKFNCPDEETPPPTFLVRTRVEHRNLPWDYFQLISTNWSDQNLVSNISINNEINYQAEYLASTTWNKTSVVITVDFSLDLQLSFLHDPCYISVNRKSFKTIIHIFIIKMT